MVNNPDALQSETVRGQDRLIKSGDGVLYFLHGIHAAQCLTGRETPIERNTFTTERLSETIRSIEESHEGDHRLVFNIVVHGWDWNTLLSIEQHIMRQGFRSMFIYSVETWVQPDHPNLFCIRDHLGQHLLMMLPGYPSDILQGMPTELMSSVSGLDPEKPGRLFNTYCQIKVFKKHFGCIVICPHPTDDKWIVDSLLFLQIKELVQLGIIDAIELNLDRVALESSQKEYVQRVISFARGLGLPVTIGLDAHTEQKGLYPASSAAPSVIEGDWTGGGCPLAGGTLVQYGKLSDELPPISPYELLREVIINGNHSMSNSYCILPRSNGHMPLPVGWDLREWLRGGIVPIIIKEILTSLAGSALDKISRKHK